MNTITITLPGSIRSKKNSKRPCYVGGKNIPKRLVLLPSKAYQAWEKEARAAFVQQHLFFSPISADGIRVRVAFYYSGKRPDLSGCYESIGDCLEGLAWADDNLICDWDGDRIHDLKNPRTEVVVEWPGVKGEE